MTESWEVFAAVTALVAAWSLLIISTLRTVLTKSIANLNERIAAFAKIPDVCRDLERELLELKADLPQSYVRREDFIRFDVVINSKLDRLRDLIESLRERERKND